MTKKQTSAKVTEVIAALRAYASPERGTFLQKFFKTGQGEYAEGDIFWGISVPVQRKIAQTYWKGMNLNDIDELLQHQAHEVRLTALIMLVTLFRKTTDDKVKTAVYDFYLDHVPQINNWDLVDTSAPTIVGEYVFDHRSEEICLRKLIQSDNLWERRMGMVAMFPFVKRGDFTLPLAQAQSLLHDKHDLIHKAVGWVLREIGKQDVSVLKHFLDTHAATMPRTALRYALEHFDFDTRQQYLLMKKNISKGASC